jgi:hypothetical protein
MSVHQNKAILSEIRALQDTIYTSGEFNYKFKDDTIRDLAMNAVISLFESEKALLKTYSENGDDLGGTVVYKGIELHTGKMKLKEDWYAAYVRIATNEKGVVRSYISSCNIETGLKLREKIGRLLTEQFGGKQIE